MNNFDLREISTWGTNKVLKYLHVTYYARVRVGIPLLGRYI